MIHGEPAAADALRHRIEEELGWSCRVPDYLEETRLACLIGAPSNQLRKPYNAGSAVSANSDGLGFLDVS